MWYLSWGIHQGTLTSRDADNPEPFATREDAEERWRTVKAGLMPGVFVWYASLRGPDGTLVVLDHGVPYQR